MNTPCQADAAVATGSSERAGSRRQGRSLTADRAGVTSIEYALMGALITVIIAGAVDGYAGGLSGLLSGTFLTIANAL